MAIVSCDFNTVMKTANGKDIEEGKDKLKLRLGHLCVQALSGSFEGDKRDGKQKAADWRLCMKITTEDENTFQEVELNDKQRTHLKELLEKIYPSPQLCIQAAWIIDPDESKEADDS